MSPQRIRKKREVEQDVWTLALERMRRAYDLFDQVVVSFSGGKDSTATLHAALAVAEERGALPLKAVFWDEECVDPDTIAYVERVRDRDDVDLRWLCLPVQHRNGCSRSSPYWYPWDPDCPELWVRDLPEGAETTLPGFARHKIPEANVCLFDPADGITAAVLGLRAVESLNRYYSVARTTQDNFIATDASARWVRIVKPIYDWRTSDVWTAPRVFGWDYNRAYDLMDKAGISPHEQRCAPPFGEQPMQSLWKWQVCWPDLWDRMSIRVPGAATAARYSRTAVYSFGDSPQPPPGMTWQEAIAYYVGKHPTSVRADVAKRIQGHIASHKSKTTRPIPTTEPDIYTGTCWSLLLKIAIRGDLKGRRHMEATATRAGAMKGIGDDL